MPITFLYFHLQANAMEAFSQLKLVLESLETKYGLHSDFSKKMKDALQNAHLYIRNYYKLSLKQSSGCPSHCLTFGLSENESQIYSERCNHLHLDICFQCQNLSMIYNNLMGALDKCKDKMEDDICYQELKKNVTDSQKHIHDYQRHLIRYD